MVMKRESWFDQCCKELWRVGLFFRSELVFATGSVRMDVILTVQYCVSKVKAVATVVVE